MKSIFIRLNLPEIIYDIQNKTYLTGRAVSDGTNHAHVAHIQANDDDENAAQILRSITMAFSILKTKMGEYLDGNVTTSTNDSLSTTDELELQLQLPSNFNQGVTAVLGEAAHQFIVASAIADWFAITAKGETTDYTAIASESLRILEESLCKRVRPKRAERS